MSELPRPITRGPWFREQVEDGDGWSPPVGTVETGLILAPPHPPNPDNPAPDPIEIANVVEDGDAAAIAALPDWIALADARLERIERLERVAREESAYRAELIDRVNELTSIFRGGR